MKGQISSILRGHLDLVDSISTQDEKDFIKQYGKDISAIGRQKIETIISPNTLNECYAAAAAASITFSMFDMDSFTMEFEFSVGDRTIKFGDLTIEMDMEVKCPHVEQCVAVEEVLCAWKCLKFAQWRFQL